MATTVNVFFYSGTAQAFRASGTAFASDSVSLLKQPYLARDQVSATSTAASSAAAPSGARIAEIQVEDGKAVHYEVNPPSRAVDADASSPAGSGTFQLEAGTGWTISFYEKTVA